MPLIDWVSDLIARDLMWQERPIGNTMSKSLFGLRITASMLLWTVASVSAQQLGTAEQARAMLDRAISALKSNEATALSEFNDPNDKQFHDRDLYIFCYNISDGKITAYESPALLNIDVRTLALKDDPIGQRVYEAVQSAPEGSIVTIEYKLPKPGTTEPVPKQTLETALGIKAAGSHTTNRYGPLTGRERSIARKRCLPGRCHCKSDTKKIKHYKPKVVARQRNNYGYGNALGYAEESGYGPRGLFSANLVHS